MRNVFVWILAVSVFFIDSHFGSATANATPLEVQTVQFNFKATSELISAWKIEPKGPTKLHIARQIQKNLGVKVDGLIGKKTIAAMEKQGLSFKKSVSIKNKNLESLIRLLRKNSFKETDYEVFNPDRGFYPDLGNNNLEEGHYGGLPWDNISRRDNVYELVELKSISTNRGVPLRKEWFRLDKFRKQPLSDKYLIDLQHYFNQARLKGVQIIPRWAYTFPNEPDDINHHLTLKKERKPHEKGITAETGVMLHHIRQLSKVINQNKDVIAYVEMGLIGEWGEWQDDKYGNPPGKGEFWHDHRAAVAKEWLKNTDPDVFFALRYPSDYANPKINNLEGIERIGLHHDCPNYISDLYPRYREKIKNVPLIGGEFCDIDPTLDYSCSTMTDYFEEFRFFAFRGAWPDKMFQEWLDNGCLNEIRKRLGYRYVILGSELADNQLYFVVKNVGFSADFKDRKVSLIVDGTKFETDIDLRKWKPNELIVEKVNLGQTRISIANNIYLEIQGGVRLANTSGNLVYSVSNEIEGSSINIEQPNTNEVLDLEVFDVGEEQIGKEWIHAHITLKDAKSSSEKKTISVSLEGHISDGEFYAIMLGRGTFSLLIPKKLSTYKDSSRVFFISDESLVDGTFNKVYEALTQNDKLVLKRICSHFARKEFTDLVLSRLSKKVGSIGNSFWQKKADATQIWELSRICLAKIQQAG